MHFRLLLKSINEDFSLETSLATTVFRLYWLFKCTN